MICINFCLHSSSYILVLVHQDSPLHVMGGETLSRYRFPYSINTMPSCAQTPALHCKMLGTWYKNMALPYAIHIQRSCNYHCTLTVLMLGEENVNVLTFKHLPDTFYSLHSALFPSKCSLKAASLNNGP